MEEKIFREFLEKKGCKFTKERAAILREVFSNHGHFDPEDLFSKYGKRKRRHQGPLFTERFSFFLNAGL